MHMCTAIITEQQLIHMMVGILTCMVVDLMDAVMYRPSVMAHFIIRNVNLIVFGATSKSTVITSEPKVSVEKKDS